MQMPDTTRGRIPYMPLMFAAILAMLMFAPAAGAQQGPSCPAGQANVLQPDGTFICVPENIEDQTPEQIEAVVNDPRPNAETPIIEQQEVDPAQLTPAQAEAAGFEVPTQPAPDDGIAEEPTVSCDDFTTIFGEPSQFQAQQFFDTVATPEEQAILDPEGNGFACDGGQIVFGEDPAEAPAPADETAAPVAEAPVADDAAALPETGGPALLLPLAGLMVAAGIGLAFIRRR